MLTCATSFLEYVPQNTACECLSSLTCLCRDQDHCNHDAPKGISTGTDAINPNFDPSTGPYNQDTHGIDGDSQGSTAKCRTIDDLPFDILSSILELAISIEQGGEEYFEKLYEAWLEQFAGSSVEVPASPTSIPSRLSLVNKTWRRTLHSLPLVWNKIVYHPQYTHTNKRGQPSYIHHSITQSSSVPLDATIWLPAHDHQAYSRRSSAAHVEALETLIGASPRWKSLRLFIGPISESCLLASPFTGILGHLETLESLAIACDDSNLPASGVIPLFRDSPSLRRLEISGIAARSLALPWMQIAELKTRWMQFRDILELMSRCQQVQNWEWTVRDPEVWIMGGPASSRVELASLTSLDLEIADGGLVTCVPSVLSKFSLPSLQSLTLQASAHSGLFCSMKSTEVLADLFSDCTELRSLALSGVYFREWDLSIILSSLSRLDTLCLTETPSMSADHEGYLALLCCILQRRVSLSHPQDILLPRLKRLEYRNTQPLSPAHLETLGSLGMTPSHSDAFVWSLC